jgi:hypothetical protein
MRLVATSIFALLFAACIVQTPAQPAAHTGPAVNDHRTEEAAPDGSSGTGGTAQDCPPGQVCNIDCSQGGCAIDCEHGAVCNIDCSGGGCTADCDNGSTCNMDCSGGGCTYACDNGANCNVDCSGGGCSGG